MTRPMPISRVTKERPARRKRRLTRPTEVAQSGSRSGLTAIAPMIRIELSVITPSPATTPATIISST